MKLIVLSISLLCSAVTLQAQNKVIASVSRLTSNQGVCRACLFINAASFAKMDAFQCKAVSIIDKKAQITFQDVPKGKYALFIFHDVNENNKLDKNWLGIPKEGYGASRNQLPFAAAPAFEPNSFILNQKDSLFLPVQLRNL